MVDKLVSVVIPVYNGESTIGYVLESILNQDYPHVEVIIVDNGSTDNTSIIVSKYRDAFKSKGYALKYIKYPKPLGHAPAINIGIKESSGQYVLILHADVMLCSQNWISTMVNILNNDNRVAVVSSMLITKPEELNFINRVFSYIYILGWHDYLKIPPMYVPYTGLNNDLIRASIFKDVGLLDESYKYGVHDIDFAEKIRRRGYLIRLETSVCAKHLLSYDQRSLKGHLKKARQYGYPSGIILKRYGYLLNIDNALFFLSLLLDLISYALKIPIIYPSLLMIMLLLIAFRYEPKNYYGKNKLLVRAYKNIANITAGLTGYLLWHYLLVMGLGAGVPLYRALSSSYNSFRDFHDIKLAITVFVLSLIWYIINGAATIIGLFKYLTKK